ncbi:MAG TPA: class I SAM-dependent methyltransferase [Lentimicrobium sp.]|nr:class I SAM-dependent methyltransferase [Lentimicrobium sp.]
MKSKTKYGIHSPFVYDFITKVIEDKNYYISYQKVEELRRRLLKNKNIVEIEDFGVSGGKAGYKTHRARVKDLTGRSSIPAKEGELLHRIVKYFRPEIMLELGTSLGISSMYQATGSPDSFFIGVEGSATRAAIAEQNLSKVADRQNYSIVIGNFNNILQTILQKLDFVDYVFLDGNHAYKPTISYFEQLLPYLRENSIMIIHDIHWSDEMNRAWNQIKKNERISVSIDLFSMGIIFFRDGIPKQDFIIRF